MILKERFKSRIMFLSLLPISNLILGDANTLYFRFFIVIL